jgi:hypothetical protein
MPFDFDDRDDDGRKDRAKRLRVDASAARVDDENGLDDHREEVTDKVERMKID